MAGFYVLRYVEGTPLSKRKHVHTLGRFSTWAEAEDARLASPLSNILEVQDRIEVRR